MSLLELGQLPPTLTTSNPRVTLKASDLDTYAGGWWWRLGTRRNRSHAIAMSSYIGQDEEVHMSVNVETLAPVQHFACPVCTYHFTFDIRPGFGCEEEDPVQSLIWHRVTLGRKECRHLTPMLAMRGFRFSFSTLRRTHHTGMIYRHIFRTEQARAGLAAPPRNTRFSQVQ